MTVTLCVTTKTGKTVPLEPLVEDMALERPFQSVSIHDAQAKKTIQTIGDFVLSFREWSDNQLSMQRQSSSVPDESRLLLDANDCASFLVDGCLA